MAAAPAPAPRAAAAPAPRPPAPPARGGTVTFPPGSTIVRPVGSGNDPWRNHAGVSPTAGPSISGFDCENVNVDAEMTPKATTAAKLRPFIEHPPTSRTLSTACTH